MIFHSVIVCLTDEKQIDFRLAGRRTIEWVFKHSQEVSDKVICMGTSELIQSIDLEHPSITFTESIENLKEHIVTSPDQAIFLFIKGNQPLLDGKILEHFYYEMIKDGAEACYLSFDQTISNARLLAITKGKLLEIVRNIKFYSYHLFENLMMQDEIQRSAKIINSSVDVSNINILDERGRVAAQEILRRLMIENWQDQGVIFDDPSSVCIDADVDLKPGALIGAFAVIRGKTIIESGARVDAFSLIQNTTIHQGASIWRSTIIDSVIESGASVGPYSFIRGNSLIKNNAQIGAYCEINDTYMGEGSKSKHFSYIGHTNVGQFTNIGAGTITCTYDGVRKSGVRIGDKAFIGSGTLLIAPVEVGAEAVTGAGAVITRDIPPSMLVYGVPGKIIRPI